MGSCISNEQILSIWNHKKWLIENVKKVRNSNTHAKYFVQQHEKKIYILLTTEVTKYSDVSPQHRIIASSPKTENL